MGKMFTRAGRASIFDRRAYTEAFFDNDAAADGAILFALVGAASYVAAIVKAGSVSAFGIRGLLEVVLGFLIAWLILAFATWFMATRLFGGSGRPQTMIAMHGLSPLPLLLEIGGAILGGIGLLWHLGVLTVATGEAASIDLRRSVVSVLVGFALAALVRALFRVPFAIFGF